MKHVQTQQRKQQTVLAVILLVLFSLQSVVAAAESGVRDWFSPEMIDSPCAPVCVDDRCDNTTPDSDFLCTEGNTHCDDCEHCLSCHLTAMVHNHTVHSVFESRFHYTFLVRLTILRLTSIDRPPIA